MREGERTIWVRLATYLVLEADVGDDADSGKHELSHGGDTRESVLHNQSHDAGVRPESTRHQPPRLGRYVPFFVCEV